MAQLNEYFQQAEFALVAYAILSQGEPSQANLINAGMTAAQAEKFATRWRVIDQFTDPATGLSATVFESAADGKRYLAIRGTNDLNDIVTDIVDIAVLGTPERQAQYAALKDQVGTWLSDGTLTAGFTVTGHSLGGFLAGALLVDYPV